MGGDREAAGDALGIVAVRALEELSACHAPISNYSAWLVRLSRNTCTDLYRERAIQRRALSRFADETKNEPSLAESAEQEMLRHELGGKVRGALDTLPKELEIPMRMRFLEGKDYACIAAALEVTPEAARKRIQKARDLLRGELAATESTQLELPVRIRKC